MNLRETFANIFIDPDCGVFSIGSVFGKALGEAALLEAGAGAQPPAGGHHINYFTCADYKTLSCRDVPKHPFLWAFFFFF